MNLQQLHCFMNALPKHAKHADHFGFGQLFLHGGAGGGRCERRGKNGTGATSKEYATRRWTSRQFRGGGEGGEERRQKRRRRKDRQKHCMAELLTVETTAATVQPRNHATTLERHAERHAETRLGEGESTRDTGRAQSHPGNQRVSVV